MRDDVDEASYTFTQAIHGTQTAVRPTQSSTIVYENLTGAGRVWALRIGVSLLFGLIAGLPAAAQWQSWLLFTHAQSFGIDDAQFGQDVGFYVFRLPFLTFVVDWLFAAPGKIAGLPRSVKIVGES